ncbi:MAG: PilZ domain-containing protein [Candidatus Electrothrix sp. EH2]|nr:PilZ domain-containing protein [Candidatus Electrothrix sp. EH2]
MLDKKEEKQRRINELRIKIYYTEILRENYKNSNLNLYETNSYYLDTLKEKLGELEKSCRELENKNQRKFSRVNIQRPVRLDFCSAQYHGVLEDISLCGSFVQGAFKQSQGAICKIDLKKCSFPFRAIGSIVRVGNSGVAVEFIAMKPKSYNWLETELLTQADEPSILEEEIFQRSIFDFDDDLVCSNIFNGNKKKLKKLLDLP